MFSRLTKVVPLMLVLVLLAISAVPAFAAPKDINSIVDVALEINSETGEFDILIAALLAADPAVISTLDGKGQFTVFAPTDEAFEDLLDELNMDAEDLLGNQELLTEVLLYHVAHGRRYANSVVTAERVRTLNKSFTYPDGATLTDNRGRTANILMTDVSADNGVIHVIDKVVLP